MFLLHSTPEIMNKYLFYISLKLFPLSVCVLQLRETASKKFNTSHEQVCLIFAGKILKDGEY